MTTSAKWTDFYRDVAKRTKNMSKCSVKVGCCIVQDGVLAGIGYNGTPKLPRGASISDELNGYISQNPEWVCDAVVNAVVHSSVNLEGAELYITSIPSLEAARIITQCRFRRVFLILDDNSAQQQALLASEQQPGQLQFLVEREVITREQRLALQLMIIYLLEGYIIM